MKAVSMVVVFLLLGACASTQNMAVSTSTLSSMHGKSVTLIQRESPSFVAMTSGKGMFAVAGVGAAAAEGNKMIRENGIVDPAMTISRVVAESLATDYGLTLQGETDVVETDSVEMFIEKSGDSDYALDVVTNGWGYMYDGFNFGDYFVGYSSRLRLIDVRTSEVISSGFCAYDAKKSGKSPVSHEKLMAENARYIEQELSAAADHCIQEFATNLFATSQQAVAQR